LRASLNSLILHIHPPTVPERNLALTRTWGLGGMALVLVVVQFFTGVALKFVYAPFPGRAYDSIRILQNEVLFGQLIRNIHYWSAVLLLVATFLHLLRVYFTGAITAPRQFNWVIGLSLFLLVLLSNFTGYLLPWDQLAYWAITICIGMVGYIPVLGAPLSDAIRGGAEVGPATISIFYTFHTFILPFSILILTAFHFWRVRKAGGVMPRPAPEGGRDAADDKVPTIPHLVAREAVAALVLVAFVLVLAVFFNAPLGDKANPGLSPNPTKAPWYFMGIQELLMHFHPLFAVLVIPLMIAGFLLYIPYIRYDENPQGAWFHSGKGIRMGRLAAVTGLVLTPALIVADEFIFKIEVWLPDIPTVVSLGLLPTAVYTFAVVLFYRWIKKRYHASNNEAVQAVFILLLTAFVLTTVVGVWFRGQGMALVWPWS
jgi:quinol-cytochrome oxidoreductase complex cytochrome b subunit